MTSLIFHDAANGGVDAIWTLFGTLQAAFAPNQGSGGSPVRVLVVNDNRLWLLSKDAKQVLFLPINTDCTGDLCLPGILKVTG